MIDWHRLFGLTMTDYFTDTAYRVEVEKDLSIKQQLLDVLIIEQQSGNPISEPPDGLENLAPHNLMTYKSLRQPLDGWALDELVGHYVNYRKQISPLMDRLLPAEDFRLYAVSTRHPDKLETEALLEPIKDGVYEVKWGSRSIGLIVLSEVAQVERNAVWQLFSGVPESVYYGSSHYHWRQTDLSTVVNQLFDFYRVEGFTMPYTVEDYKKDFKEEFLAKLTPEERLKGLPPEERLKGLPPEERLKGLPPEEILKRLPQEVIEAYIKRHSQSN
jgi:hypothetical protein